MGVKKPHGQITSNKIKPCPCCTQPTQKGQVKTTFGGAARFSDAGRTGFGSATPSGEAYYKRAPYSHNCGSHARSASLTFDNRPLASPDSPGPQDYQPRYSACSVASHSPLDGPEFCKTRMHAKTEYVVGQPPNMAKTFPGPGHYKWNNSTLGDKQVSIHLPVNYCDFPLVSGIMRERGEPRITGGPFPKNARGSKKDFCTSSAPDGDLYYSHVKPYPYNKRSTSMGRGKRTEFLEDRIDIGPGHYNLDAPQCPTCHTTTKNYISPSRKKPPRAASSG